MRGGVRWLAKCDDRVFGTILSKVIPRDIKLTGTVELSFEQALARLQGRESPQLPAAGGMVIEQIFDAAAERESLPAVAENQPTPEPSAVEIVDPGADKPTSQN